MNTEKRSGDYVAGERHPRAVAFDDDVLDAIAWHAAGMSAAMIARKLDHLARPVSARTVRHWIAGTRRRKNLGPMTSESWADSAAKNSTVDRPTGSLE